MLNKARTKKQNKTKEPTCNDAKKRKKNGDRIWYSNIDAQKLVNRYQSSQQ